MKNSGKCLSTKLMENYFTKAFGNFSQIVSFGILRKLWHASAETQNSDTRSQKFDYGLTASFLLKSKNMLQFHSYTKLNPCAKFCEIPIEPLDVFVSKHQQP